MTLITYEAIRAAQRAEQSEQLQQLPDKFFEAIRNWMDYKKGKNDEISIQEIESAKRLLTDVINRRQRKLLIAALRTVRGDIAPEGLSGAEQRFFDQALLLIKEFTEEMNKELLSETAIAEKTIEEVRETLKEIGQSEIIETPTTSVVTKPEVVARSEPKEEKMLFGPKIEEPEKLKPNSIRLLSDLPKFVGSDLKPYGPFKTSDIISVPEDIRALLMKRKVAEAVN